AVQRLADGDPDPALADAVFLDVVALLALEADADAAAEDGLVVVGAARVVAEAVGRGLVGHVGVHRWSTRDSARGAGGYAAAAPGAALSAAVRPRARRGRAGRAGARRRR